MPERGGAEAQRSVQRALAALRAGSLTFGLLGGLSCYVVLSDVLRLDRTLALVVGLLFALLTRVAAYALGRDWLLRAARRSADPAARGDATTPTGRRMP